MAKVFESLVIRKADVCRKCGSKIKVICYSCDSKVITVETHCVVCRADNIFVRAYVPREQRIDRRIHE